MEQLLSPFDAKESDTSNTILNNSDQNSITLFQENCTNNYLPDLKTSSVSPTNRRNSTKKRLTTKKRLRNYQASKGFKRQSLSPEVSVSGSLVESNSESSCLEGGEVDFYGSALDEGADMEIVEHLSPRLSLQQVESHDGTSCANDTSNDTNMCTDIPMNDSTYPEHGTGSSHMYSDTGMSQSEHLTMSQIHTNTGPCGTSDMDLNTSSNPDLVGLTTNASQGFGVLQNIHYDPNNPTHLSQNNFVTTVNGINVGSSNNISMTQLNQYNSQYIYPYNASVQGGSEEYMDYSEDMDYSAEVEYILNDGMDYVMEDGYNNDNTNLASNNSFDPNNVFINNLDNLTQSQEQLSNTHTVTNYNTVPGQMDGIVGMDDLSNDEDKQIMRNNSINVLIENSEKNFDPEVMNSILRDLVCPICLEYFYFPVTVACGHTFCRYCIGHSKLSGKMCPLCRQPIGRSLNINTILSNLVKSLKLRKRGHAKLVRVPGVSEVAEKVWWDEHCLKPYVSVPLFIRIMFGEIAQAPVFFDDLCACLIDYFNSGNRWYKSKWVFTIEDFRLLRNVIGLQLHSPNNQDGEVAANEPTPTRINDTNNLRVHHWVEDYLIANPQLCFRTDVSYPLTLKVYHDANHKIEGTVFSALDIPYKLPWDAGRHAKSLIHLPHSSVSLSHLIFAQCPNGKCGILDVGSTIGTMVKLQGVHVLKTGDRIHIGDKHEVDVYIYKDSLGTPFKDYKWDATTNQVINYAEYVNSHTSTPDRTGGMDGVAATGEESENVEVDPSINNNLFELDSYLKIKVFADLQAERDVWICPKGVILGRGPVTQSSYKKFSITTQNGYISREHCLIYYDGTRPSGSRWLLRDMSTLGTFLKLKPFQEPLPVAPGCVFKVGQCKIEVGSPNEISRRVPTSATLILSQLLHSHMEPMRAADLQNNQQVHPITSLVSAIPNVNVRVVLEEGGRGGFTRISRTLATNNSGASQEAANDVDPEGQVVPEAMREDVV